MPGLFAALSPRSHSSSRATTPSPTPTVYRTNNGATGDEESIAKLKHAHTPLPAAQISILLLLRFCEAASAFVIFPFLNELLTSVTGGDKANVGYYAGVMESIRQLVSFATVMIWSRLSDHIGRKPILLLGMSALALSMLSFGLSRVFWALVVSRCIFTAFNSNAGVIKGIIGEITDHTNSADAFALLHVPWAIGSSFGALIGGWLARPHDHFPKVFSSQFWISYPYFLPCFVLSLTAVFGVLLTAGFFNETVKGGYLYKNPNSRGNEDSEPLLESSNPTHSLATLGTTSKEDPVPLKDLLNLKILIPVMNYVCLASLHASSNAIQPLFLAMPVNIGGLELPPRDVGYILGTYGFVSSIFQTLMLGRLVRRFGVKAIFVTSISAFLPVYAFSPLMNVIVRKMGFSYVVWVVLGCQLSASLVMELGYGCVYMFITSAAPNKRSLGATHGLAQTLVSIGRIVTPAMTNSLLSFSIKHHVLGGYAVYLALLVLTLGGVWLASRLPQRLKSIND
ncbi:major facilitator superfamily domain-containing protein [Crassisporium funariophilum]|nr:major facilitator superfamily domain-containing protein [Crassisporium funariophilum]